MYKNISRVVGRHTGGQKLLKEAWAHKDDQKYSTRMVTYKDGQEHPMAGENTQRWARTPHWGWEHTKVDKNTHGNHGDHT